MCAMDIGPEVEPLEISLPKELYDDWIYKSFPHFQKDNRAFPQAPLDIDLSQCEWVSPLPLLLLATECMTHSLPNRHININLGAGGTGERAENCSRVRRFLSLHGFLDSFASRKDLIVRFQFDLLDEKGSAGQWFDASANLRSLRETLEKTKVDLLYGDTIVLPATTWILPHSSDPNLSTAIRNQVDKLLRRADIALYKFKTEARKYRNVTLQRLNQVLLELVENAAEHAYLDSEGGYVGLYARVRQTGNETASAFRAKELLHSPLLGSLLLSEKQHQIEVFVVDVGRGLFSDIAKWNTGELLRQEKHQPLRKSAGMLFVRPLSRHDRANDLVARQRGSSTGLMHLHNILEHRGDNSRIVTGDEWLASSHPRPPGFTPDSVTSGSYQQHVSGAIKGTLFHIGISPSEIPKLDSQWFVSDDPSNTEIRRSVIKKFASVALPKKLSSQVIDIRASEGLKNIGGEVTRRASKSAGTVVRVNRIAEKNLLNSIIAGWIEGIGNFKKNNPVLYLCDLGRYQAVDVAWVVERYFDAQVRFNLEAIHKDALILLVTEDLCCTQFKIQFKELDVGNSKTAAYKHIAIAGQHERDIDKLDNRLVSVLSELRNCDTERLWASISRLNEAWPFNPVLIKDVRWGEESAGVLPNYLNYSVLVQDDEAARCVRRALRRILALYPDANDCALDSLVESSLHDAKKWLLRPERDTHKRVLVGSLSVSGSTLNRYTPPPRETVIGVIDCIKSPYFDAPQSNTCHHLAALLWDPSLPIETSNPPRYQRVGRSAFVESINQEQIVSYDERLYGELEVAKLLKVGHWTYGDRHCLLEINAELAIEQSWESESGSIPWLAQELTRLCKEQPVVLAFPVDKLAYRLAHHVKSKVADAEKNKLKLLPLSYLPRIAGGITRFAPLVFDAAKLLSKDNGQGLPLAVFLDFGFITNRTMRHSVRQLHGAGFGKVIVMGLLNRSSAPSLDYETAHGVSKPFPVPITYWRWNVPTMGSGTHCFLCNALHSLASLRRVASEAHIDLLGPIEEIGRNWAARDVADFWEEYGLTPIVLTDDMRQSIAPMFPNVPQEAMPTTSSALSARVIERFRITGDTTFPLAVAKTLMAKNGNEQAVELIATTLALANSSFTSAESHEYIAILSHAAIDLGMQPYEQHNADRVPRLLGLATLVFATRDCKCKLEVQKGLCSNLESKDIAGNPYLRLALIALTTDSDESEEVETAFHAFCTADRGKATLIRNYHAIRSQKGTAKETWAKLTQAFGRSTSHSQQSALGILKADFSRNEKPSKVIRHIDYISSLLGQCDKDFVMNCLEIDLFGVIKDVQKLASHARDPSTTNKFFNEAIENTFRIVSDKLHSALKRFGSKAESSMVAILFEDVLKEQTRQSQLSLGADIVVTDIARGSKWAEEPGGYLPICGQVTKLFGEVFSNIRGKSEKLPPPDLPEFAGCTHEAYGWIWFDTRQEAQGKGIEVILVTGVNSPMDISPYHPKVPGLNGWGIVVGSRNFQSQGRKYFEIRIHIPSLAAILEEL